MKFFNHIHSKLAAENLSTGQGGKVMAYLCYTVDEIMIVK
jgi:hypothetical protein